MPQKHTFEQKAEAVRELLDGVAIPPELRARYQVSENEMRRWLNQAVDCLEGAYQAGEGISGETIDYRQAILSEYELKFLLGDGH